jgi:endonuclease YncB( thermonuclease family)
MNNRLTLFVAGFFFIFLFPFNAVKAAIADGYYQVDSAINGESFKLTNGQTVKLIGVEAPQSWETCSLKATDRLSSLIEGETVYLEKDVSETDDSDRLLRYAYINDMFINYNLVYDGYLFADINYPDIKYAAELTDAEENARRYDRGCLWYGNCIGCDDDYNVFVGCFIATAAYGSPIDPHVEILRKFRDHYLLTNTLGRSLIRLYYTYSPLLANTISHHKNLRIMARIALLPFIGFGWMTLKLGIVSTIAIWLLVVITLIGLHRLMKKN